MLKQPYVSELCLLAISVFHQDTKCWDAFVYLRTVLALLIYLHTVFIFICSC